MKKRQIVIVVGVVILVIILALFFMPKGTNSKKVVVRLSSLKEAEKEFNQGHYIEAKELYKKAMEELENPNKLKKIQERIGEVNIKIIFSGLMDECSKAYIVKPKDALSKIARKFNTTVSFIKRTNNLTSDIIRLGRKLKVSICKFSIVVDKSQNLLFLKRKGEVIKIYIVSTGKDNGTPIGTFKIVNKLVKPTWFRTGAVIAPDSPENVLGSRWMGFDLKGYGIHGTTEPENLGKQITLGCIRMRNEEVEELYAIIPTGTEVVIID